MADDRQNSVSSSFLHDIVSLFPWSEQSPSMRKAALIIQSGHAIVDAMMTLSSRSTIGDNRERDIDTAAVLVPDIGVHYNRPSRKARPDISQFAQENDGH